MGYHSFKNKKKDQLLKTEDSIAKDSIYITPKSFLHVTTKRIIISTLIKVNIFW